MPAYGHRRGKARVSKLYDEKLRHKPSRNPKSEVEPCPTFSEMPNLPKLTSVNPIDYRGPTQESNWLLPNRIMAGAFPACENDGITRSVLRKLMNLGVTTFVCLQSEFDPRASKDHWRQQGKLRPYMHDATALQAEMGKPEKLHFLHFSIVDCSVADDKSVIDFVKQLCWRANNGEVLYVHCWGGHGRTGTVLSLMLSAIYRIDPIDSMMMVQACHDIRSCPMGVASPQTSQQRLQVCRLGGIILRESWLPKPRPKSSEEPESESRLLLGDDVSNKGSNSQKKAIINNRPATTGAILKPSLNSEVLKPPIRRLNNQIENLRLSVLNNTPSNRSPNTPGSAPTGSARHFAFPPNSRKANTPKPHSPNAPRSPHSVNALSPNSNFGSQRRVIRSLKPPTVGSPIARDSSSSSNTKSSSTSNSSSKQQKREKSVSFAPQLERSSERDNLGNGSVNNNDSGSNDGLPNNNRQVNHNNSNSSSNNNNSNSNNQTKGRKFNLSTLGNHKSFFGDDFDVTKAVHSSRNRQMQRQLQQRNALQSATSKTKRSLGNRLVSPTSQSTPSSPNTSNHNNNNNNNSNGNNSISSRIGGIAGIVKTGGFGSPHNGISRQQRHQQQKWSFFPVRPSGGSQLRTSYQPHPPTSQLPNSPSHLGTSHSRTPRRERVVVADLANFCLSGSKSTSSASAKQNKNGSSLAKISSPSIPPSSALPNTSRSTNRLTGRKLHSTKHSSSSPKHSLSSNNRRNNNSSSFSNNNNNNNINKSRHFHAEITLNHV
eukprot:TRINITY_DN1515_c0_g1_i1.p1 TRINITY_DN1515_c0_g1~~TRINITY_DN1515_c0_g1_i1.p1  ORF type:complete len:783 (+),score=226.63 TRINITY_DN1515_c0_g1_i1:40-2349(+)